MQRWTRDDFHDPLEDLRYAEEITTRDVADLLGVTQAAVRRWVVRGYISPVGRFGPSNVFRPNDVLAAYEQITRDEKRLAIPAAAVGGPLNLDPSTAFDQSTTTRSSMSVKPPGYSESARRQFDRGYTAAISFRSRHQSREISGFVSGT
jgi:hypothetical protein